MARVWPAFDGLCRSTAGIPRLTLGYYRGEEITGVMSYYPDLKDPVLRHLTRHPVAYVAAVVRGLYVRWRSRPRLPAAALVRWRAYVQLVTTQTPKTPRLHVLALGVAKSARRMGIARKLLDAIATDERWRNRAEVIQVDTWHPSNVTIYGRLGFHVIAHGAKDGVDCWTMVRPMPERETTTEQARPRMAPDDDTLEHEWPIVLGRR